MRYCRHLPTFRFPLSASLAACCVLVVTSARGAVTYVDPTLGDDTAQGRSSIASGPQSRVKTIAVGRLAAGTPRLEIEGKPVGAAQAAATRPDGNPRTAYFSVGDNQDLLWLPIDSRASVETAFDALRDRYRIERVWCRGGNVQRLTGLHSAGPGADSARPLAGHGLAALGSRREDHRPAVERHGRTHQRRGRMQFARARQFAKAGATPGRPVQNAFDPDKTPEEPSILRKARVLRPQGLAQDGLEGVGLAHEAEVAGV